MSAVSAGAVDDFQRMVVRVAVVAVMISVVALKLAKLRLLEVYSIRHNFLTRLGESGCDVWTLARIAGHSNIRTSQRYVYPSEDAVLNAPSRLEGHNIEHSPEIATPTKGGELLLSDTVTSD